MSKRGNGLKWPNRCFKCFQNMTKSSLPMSSQVMKPESIILSPSERLAIRSGPLKQQTPNNCQTFFECQESFVCNLLLCISGKYYKDVVLKKLKKYYEKRRPATGFKHVRLLHDNAPTHTSAIVTAFLKKEKVTVLPHPPYSPDLAPCDFFLFPKLKSFLAGRKYQSRHALGSGIHHYLITVPKSAYRDAFKKWIHRLKLCIFSHGEYFEGMK